MRCEAVGFVIHLQQHHVDTVIGDGVGVNETKTASILLQRNKPGKKYNTRPPALVELLLGPNTSDIEKLVETKKSNIETRSEEQFVLVQYTK